MKKQIEVFATKEEIKPVTIRFEWEEMGPNPDAHFFVYRLPAEEVMSMVKSLFRLDQSLTKHKRRTKKKMAVDAEAGKVQSPIFPENVKSKGKRGRPRKSAVETNSAEAITT